MYAHNPQPALDWAVRAQQCQPGCLLYAGKADIHIWHKLQLQCAMKVSGPATAIRLPLVRSEYCYAVEAHCRAACCVPCTLVLQVSAGSRGVCVPEAPCQLGFRAQGSGYRGWRQQRQRAAQPGQQHVICSNGAAAAGLPQYDEPRCHLQVGRGHSPWTARDCCDSVAPQQFKKSWWCC